MATGCDTWSVAGRGEGTQEGLRVKDQSSLSLSRIPPLSLLSPTRPHERRENSETAWAAGSAKHSSFFLPSTNPYSTDGRPNHACDPLCEDRAPSLFPAWVLPPDFLFPADLGKIPSARYYNVRSLYESEASRVSLSSVLSIDTIPDLVDRKMATP